MLILKSLQFSSNVFVSQLHLKILSLLSNCPEYKSKLKVGSFYELSRHIVEVCFISGTSQSWCYLVSATFKYVLWKFKKKGKKFLTFLLSLTKSFLSSGQPHRCLQKLNSDLIIITLLQIFYRREVKS